MPFDIDVFLAQLLDPSLREGLTDPDVVQAVSRGLIGQMPGVGQFADVVDSFGQPGIADDPNRARAQARISTMDRLKADVERAVSKKERAEATQASEEAAAQDEWVRSVGYEPDQDLSDPEKGILFEEMPAEKLLALRKGAAPRAEGYTGGEGTFSQGTMTPEIAAREAELKQWLSGQDERNAQYALTPEQARRDPAAAKLASERLVDLKRNAQIDARQKSIDEIVAKMSGAGGTIPFEQAKQLETLGVDLPWGVAGSSTESGVEFFDAVIMESGKAMSAINPLAAMENPALALQGKYEQLVNEMGEKYRAKVKGGMNPDDAKAEFWRTASQLAVKMGLANLEEVQQQSQQMQPQASQ